MRTVITTILITITVLTQRAIASGFTYVPICTGVTAPSPTTYPTISLNDKVQFYDAGIVPGNCTGGDNHVYVLAVNGNGILARNKFDIYYLDNNGKYTKVPTDKKTGFPKLNPDGTIPQPPYRDPLPTWNSASIYRDADNNIFLVAPDFLTSSTKVQLAGNSTIGVVKHSDKCGVLTVKFTTLPTSLSIDGQTIALSSILQGGKSWHCSNGTLTNSPFNSNLTALQDGNKFYFIKPPSTKFVISYTGGISKTLRYNSCGFVILKNNSDLSISDSSTVNSTVVSSLPVVPTTPICKKGRLELAQSWQY